MRRSRRCLGRTSWLFGIVAVLAVGLTACPAEGPDQEATAAADPAAIQSAWDAFLAAWEDQDIEAGLRAFSDDAVAFDPVPPGRFEGQTGIRNWMAGAFDAFEEITIDTEDVRVRTEGAVGWVTARYTFTGTPLQGEPVVDEGYATMLWTPTADGIYRSPLFHASVLPEGQTEGGSEGSPAVQQGES